MNHLPSFRFLIYHKFCEMQQNSLDLITNNTSDISDELLLALKSSRLPNLLVIISTTYNLVFNHVTIATEISINFSKIPSKRSFKKDRDKGLA